MTFRVFLIGFAPPGWYDVGGHIANIPLAKRLIQESDFTAIAENGIGIGERVGTALLVNGAKGALPLPGKETLVCVGHEYGGKVAIMSDEADNAA